MFIGKSKAFYQLPPLYYSSSIKGPLAFLSETTEPDSSGFIFIACKDIPTYFNTDGIISLPQEDVD